MSPEPEVSTPPDVDPTMKAVTDAFERVGAAFGTMLHQTVESFTAIGKAFIEAFNNVHCGASAEGVGPCLLEMGHTHDHLSSKGNGVKAWKN